MVEQSNIACDRIVYMVKRLGREVLAITSVPANKAILYRKLSAARLDFYHNPVKTDR